MLTCLINGVAADEVSVGERALQYGDGLFETIAVRQGQAEFIDRHIQRLQAGCQRLALGFGDWSSLRTEVGALSASYPDAVLKIILGRGPGERGYRTMPGQPVTRIISAHGLPEWPDEYAKTGIRVRVCETRLSIQPRLAGIKHLNRLEQVLARAEWQDEFQEGLLLDYNSRLMEATMSNLFLVRNGGIVTPKLKDCGVAGVMRSVIIDLAEQSGIPCSIEDVSSDALDNVTGMFVCNSLIGIWPVTGIEGRESLEVDSTTRELQAMLNRCGKTQPGEWRPF
jgi:4-amino-4-deoxychorismate lyase